MMGGIPRSGVELRRTLPVRPAAALGPARRVLIALACGTLAWAAILAGAILLRSALG